MAIQPCRECGKDVSTEAPACPHCGTPNPIDVPTPAPSVAPAKTKRRRWPWIALGAFALLAMCTTMNQLRSGSGTPTPSKPATPAATPAPTKMPARLVITLEKVEYDHGFFKVFGIAKNEGEMPASGPLVQLEVFTDDGRTLLGRAVLAPIGYIGKAMVPGETGAIELTVRVPGERSRVKWQVSSNLPYEIKDTSKGKK